MTTNSDDTRKTAEMAVSKMENTAQTNSDDTNLTEQWKKGELEGEYYIETTDGKIYIVEFQNSISVKKKKLSKVKSFKGYVYKKTVKEVLAPVPSYDEWQRIFHYAGKYEHEYTSCAMDYENLKQENQQLHKFLEEFNALDVAKENQQLKELLKECQYMILAYSINHDTFTKEKVLDVVTKIDNAIGEKK